MKRLHAWLSGRMMPPALLIAWTFILIGNAILFIVAVHRVMAH